MLMVLRAMGVVEIQVKMGGVLRKSTRMLKSSVGLVTVGGW